jgi:hypothetical protein
MPDPFRGPPGTNPPRHVPQHRDNRAFGWTLGVVAVVALFSVSYWAWSERVPAPVSPTAVTGAAAPPPASTTGQAERPPR